MKTEQTLMCVLFAVCAALVIGVMVTMLSTHIPPAQMQLAHSAAASLPVSSG